MFLNAIRLINDDVKVTTIVTSYCIKFLNKNANFFIYFNHILNIKNTIKLKQKQN